MYRLRIIFSEPVTAHGDSTIHINFDSVEDAKFAAETIGVAMTEVIDQLDILELRDGLWRSVICSECGCKFIECACFDGDDDLIDEPLP